jgi:hypothetical protein
VRVRVKQDADIDVGDVHRRGLDEPAVDENAALGGPVSRWTRVHWRIGSTFGTPEDFKRLMHECDGTFGCLPLVHDLVFHGRNGTRARCDAPGSASSLLYAFNAGDVTGPGGGAGAGV